MAVEFKYLATKSGKSLVLCVDDRKYVFGVFEGFQRYSMDAEFDTSGTSCIFLQEEKSVLPFVWTYINLKDTMWKGAKVSCNPTLQPSLEAANNLTLWSQLKFDYADNYNDSSVSVEHVESNHVVRVRRTRSSDDTGAKLGAGDSNGKDLVGAICHGRHAELWDLARNRELDYIICFEAESAQFLRSVFDGTVFVLCDNSFVEYRSFYGFQRELNLACCNFLLPKQTEASSEPEGVVSIQSRDSLVYDPGSLNFKHVAAEQVEYVPVVTEKKERYVLFLGTGCFTPCKLRNVSSVLYDSPHGAILFDCGDDTISQISRAYGNCDVLSRIVMVFVSHSHPDHVLGAISLLRKVEQRIKIVGPRAVNKFLEASGMTNYDFIETNHAKVLEGEFSDSGPTWDDIADPSWRSAACEKYLLNMRVGTFDLSVYGTDHILDSCGVRIKDGDTTVSYSGDGRPSILFAAMSFGADVMIHEATFLQDEHERALRGKHSTVDEAMEVFRNSRSKYLLLTHVSNRYSSKIISGEHWTQCVDLFRYVIE